MAMSQLDDRGWVTRNDPHGMFSLFESFPNHCRIGLAIGENLDLEPLPRRPGVVCLAGMGGSAAGGDIIRCLFDAHGSVPFIVNRDYHLPNCVGVGDLVFCTSYSGNTEETLSAYADAKQAGARIIVVTTGGKLATLAEQDGFPAAIVPPGIPPRAALGYMLMPALTACRKLKLLPDLRYDAAISALDVAVASYTVESTDSPAKQLAASINGKIPVIYGLGSWQGAIANRWKGQINENAKSQAFAATFPELNHNEILGWVNAASQGGKWQVVILQDGQESTKMRARAALTTRLISGAASVESAHAMGEDLLTKMLTLACLGDFVSLYLAALIGVDPFGIEYLDVLKSELNKVD